MTIAVIVAVCIILAILAFLLPRASWWPQKGVDKTLGTGQDAAGEAARQGRRPRREAVRDLAQGRQPQRPEGPRGPRKMPDLAAPMIALLANPDSGSGEAGEVERCCASAASRSPASTSTMPTTPLAAAPERIVVAGGDGSVGCAAAAAARAGVPLGVVPVGTANDFARALELPDDPAEAVELAATGERTRAPRPRPRRRRARSSTPPAPASRRSRPARRDGLKGALGPLAYTVGALRAGLFADPVTAPVTVDGERAIRRPRRGR